MLDEGAAPLQWDLILTSTVTSATIPLSKKATFGSPGGWDFNGGIAGGPSSPHHSSLPALMSLAQTLEVRLRLVVLLCVFWLLILFVLLPGWTIARPCVFDSGSCAKRNPGGPADRPAVAEWGSLRPPHQPGTPRPRPCAREGTILGSESRRNSQ